MTDLTTFWAQNRANWEKPGALVRDPETGERWRCCDVVMAPLWTSCADYTTRWQQSARVTQDDKQAGEALDRAIAAGPVVDDAATWGILLDWLTRVWCKTVEYRAPNQGPCVYRVRWLTLIAYGDNGAGQGVILQQVNDADYPDKRSIIDALRWVYSSDCPAKVTQ